MKRLAVVLVLVSACGSDDGTPLPTCTECGPGAIDAGRFTGCPLGPEPVVANRQGTVLRILCQSFAWLGPTFTTEADTTFDQSIIDLALDDAGGTAVSIGDFANEDTGQWADAAVVGFGPDHEQTWRVELGMINTAVVSASPAMIALVTDARQVEGTTVTPSPGGQATLVALHAGDGSVAWNKPLAVSTAFAPDGTLLVAGLFDGSLDLGGTSTPLTAHGDAGYIAALDPATGDGRWAVALPNLGNNPAFVIAMSAATSGEVAIKIEYDDDTTFKRTDEVMLLDASGTVLWTQLANPAFEASIVTDGVHVFDADSAFTTTGTSVPTFTQYSATGLDWRRPITSDGTVIARVLALAGDRLVASIHSEPLGIEDPPSSTTIGDVSWTGDGLALVDLVH